MAIRTATEADIPRLLEMARAFFAKSGMAQVTTFDDDSAEATFRHLMRDGVILMTDNAAVGALLYPFYFNHAHITGQELFWYSESPGDGRALFDALESEVLARGAQSFSMVELASLPGPGRIYERRGYRASETAYIKVM